MCLHQTYIVASEKERSFLWDNTFWSTLERGERIVRMSAWMMAKNRNKMKTLSIALELFINFNFI
jgi:hypothetical protein